MTISGYECSVTFMETIVLEWWDVTLGTADPSRSGNQLSIAKMRKDTFIGCP